MQKLWTFVAYQLRKLFLRGCLLISFAGYYLRGQKFSSTFLKNFSAKLKKSKQRNSEGYKIGVFDGYLLRGLFVRGCLLPYFAAYQLEEQIFYVNITQNFSKKFPTKK